MSEQLVHSGTQHAISGGKKEKKKKKKKKQESSYFACVRRLGWSHVMQTLCQITEQRRCHVVGVCVAYVRGM